MLFISKTIRDSAIPCKFWTPMVPRSFLNFGHHLEFWWKWKISFISETIRDRAISAKYWIQKLLILPQKVLQIGNFFLNKSFTYFWVIYYVVKLQNCSSLGGRLIATKMSKCLLSLKVLQPNIKVSLAYCHFYMFLHLTRKAILHYL